MSLWIIVMWTAAGQFLHYPLMQEMTGGDCMRVARQLVHYMKEPPTMYGCVENSGKET